MFSLTRSDVQRIAVSALGALAVSATCVFGAVGPAVAATPTTVPAWTSQVEDRIADAARGSHLSTDPVGHAEVALHFTADGDFAGATLAGSSGNRLIDRRAVALASRIRYPRLPETARGQARDVTMRLWSGEVPSIARHLAPAAMQVAAR